MSDREANGKLIRIPGIVEVEATKPIKLKGVPRLVAKGFKTGFLDKVELKIANSPIIQSAQKTIFLTFFICKIISKPAKKFLLHRINFVIHVKWIGWEKGV